MRGGRGSTWTRRGTRWGRPAFAQIDAKIEQRFAEMRTYLEKGLKDQTRWMFLAWSTLLVPIIGLIVPVIGLWMRR